jgi:hypothetical protein
MEKEFVPYEIALALKGLGFDEPCLAQWDEMELYPLQQGGESAYFEPNKNSRLSFNTMAPTFSQCFRWFREKYGLFATIDGLEERLYYKITQTNEYSKEYSTYEEAELECLKKLIEIVKSQK